MREEHEIRTKNEINPDSLTRWLYESAMDKSERTNRRMFILVIVLALMLFISNLAWIIYENQFEEISIEQEVDTGEGDAVVAGGDIYGYGKAESEDP